MTAYRKLSCKLAKKLVLKWSAPPDFLQHDKKGKAQLISGTNFISDLETVGLDCQAPELFTRVKSSDQGAQVGVVRQPGHYWIFKSGAEEEFDTGSAGLLLKTPMRPLG